MGKPRPSEPSVATTTAATTGTAAASAVSDLQLPAVRVPVPDPVGCVRMPGRSRLGVRTTMRLARNGAAPVKSSGPATSATTRPFLATALGGMRVRRAHRAGCTMSCHTCIDRSNPPCVRRVNTLDRDCRFVLCTKHEAQASCGAATAGWSKRSARHAPTRRAAGALRATRASSAPCLTTRPARPSSTVPTAASAALAAPLTIHTASPATPASGTARHAHDVRAGKYAY